jgi:hypothetical protein
VSTYYSAFGRISKDMMEIAETQQAIAPADKNRYVPGQISRDHTFVVLREAVDVTEVDLAPQLASDFVAAAKGKQQRTPDAFDATETAGIVIAVSQGVPALPALSLPMLVLVGVCLAICVCVAIAYAANILDSSWRHSDQLPGPLKMSFVSVLHRTG